MPFHGLPRRVAGHAEGVRRSLALLSALALVVSCSRGGDQPNGEAKPSPSVSPAGVRATTRDTAELALGRRDQINDLVATDDLPPTAVGQTTRADGTGTLPVVWSATGDRGWERTALPLSDATRAFLQDVTALEGSALAVGGREVDGAFEASAWMRRDGTWTLAGPLSTEEGVSGTTDVAGHDGVAVAIGTVDPAGSETTADRNRVWTSTDGESWTTTDDPSFHAEGTELTDVAVGPSGMVIVGLVDDGTATSARAWWSEDGSGWEVIDVGGGAGSSLTQVVTVGGRFVAGGAVTPGANDRPAVWRSPDGRSWGKPRTDLPVRETGTATSGGAEVAGLTSRGGVIAATNGLGSTPEVWRSTAAEGWTSWGGSLAAVEGYRDDPSPLDIALGDGGQPIVAVDEGPNLLVPEDGTWVEARGAAKVLSLDTPYLDLATSAVHDGDLVLAGTARMPMRPGRPQPIPTVLWRERRTGGWSRQEPPMLVDHVVGDAINTDIGMVAVGFEVLTTEGTDNALAAVRADGTWRHVEGMAALEARHLVDVERWRGGWLAVGVAKLYDPTRVNGAALRRVVVQGVGGAETPPTPSTLEGLPVDPAGDQSLDGLCTNDQGVVIVGTDIGAGGATRPMVAHAPDPSGTWVLGSADDDFASRRPGTTVDDCTANAAGEYLLHGGTTGDDGQPEPLVWHSADGGTWERVAPERWGGGGAQEVTDLVALDEGWLAIGTDSPEGAGSDVAAWYVGPDLTVSRVPLAGDVVGPAEQTVTSVVARGDEVIVVGTDDGGPAVWSLSQADLLAAA